MQQASAQNGRLQKQADALPTGNTTMIAIPPCRVLDTRLNNAYTGGAFAAGETRSYVVSAGPCAGIPPTAAAYSFNFTVTGTGAGGWLTVFPTGGAMPFVSTLNYLAGQTIANAAIIPAGTGGAISIYSVAASQVIVDINGYFLESATSANTPNTLVLRDATGSFSAGTITATKVLNAVYQDVAEWVPSDTMTPGEVVVLDPKDGRRVVASSHAYDTAVAGVVSENPGIVLGRGDATKAQIATTGRVIVNVDATTAPIAVGDLLVTSDVAGTAMKSVPLSVDGTPMHRPGTIVGKALQPLASGKGRILVLLSLQ